VVRKTAQTGLGCLLQYIVEDPSPLKKWASGNSPRSQLKQKLRWSPFVG
jgi:hypothetical protein